MQDRTWLDEHFQVSFERRVALDNVVSWEGQAYELPIGHAGEKILITRHLLDASLSVCHQGRQVEIHPVDLEANAYSRRGRGEKDASPQPKPARTAGSMRYDADFGPIVGPDGNFPKGDQDDQDEQDP